MTTSACVSPVSPLPDYVVYDPSNPPAPEVLLKPAQTVTFPLNTQDQQDIATLVAKYEQEENCAGLAAPQIGIAKRMIVFAVQDDVDLKKWRPDLTDTIPQSVWINPTYEGIEADGWHEDYEACFSVKDMAGNVSRYNTITYQAFTPEGKNITGTARGFLARLIQHETDHTQGILFSDRTKPGELMHVDDYREKRRAAMAE